MPAAPRLDGRQWRAMIENIKAIADAARTEFGVQAVNRIDYIHFKDIDQAAFTRGMRERIRFFEACAQGVMCPLGRGVIDYRAIRGFLDRSGSSGCITVEQEQDPRNAGGSLGGSLKDVKASRVYLTSVGF